MRARAGRRSPRPGRVAGAERARHGASTAAAAAALASLLASPAAGCFGGCECGPNIGLDAAGFADGTAPGTDASSPGTDSGPAGCWCGDGICDPGCGELCDLCADCGPCPAGGGLRTLFDVPDIAPVAAFWVELGPLVAGGGYGSWAGCWGRTIEPAGTGPVSSTVALANDDDAAAVTFPFAFPFYGVGETEAWISANGHLTFGAPDLGTTITLEAHDAFPRIAPLMSDLAGGTIVVDEFADHVNVHWIGWNAGGAPSVDIHLALSADGMILFMWEGEAPAYPLVIGVSDGSGAGSPLDGLWPLC